MNLDALLFAVVAFVILARLWSVLGQKNDNEPQRPNPFERVNPPDTASETTATEPMDGHPPIIRALRLAPESLAGGLAQLRNMDPSFDEKTFLSGAKTAFSMVVEGYMAGDLSRASSFIDASVRARFDAAIAARVAVGQSIEGNLISVKDAEVTQITFRDRVARLTVRFVSLQKVVLRDQTGAIVGGEEGKVEEITDIWAFERDTASTNPNWTLVAT